MPKKNSSNRIYYPIGQVANMFNVSTSLIRFWEKEFPVLRPRKNKKGNRLFTERDVRYLHMIYHLVKNKGYTLQGARDALKSDFDQIEEKVILLATLNNMRSFLNDLDHILAEKQKNQ